MPCHRHPRLFVPILGILSFLASALALGASAPEPYGPVPNDGQMIWHRSEMIGLICLGLNTYTDQEWGFGIRAERFSPADLDTGQWAEACKAAGMTGLVLVAKHHDGFCLWPSKLTDYSVKSSPWRDGKGDLLGDLAKSCNEYGLRLGVYISPWDRNHAEYGREDYIREMRRIDFARGKKVTASTTRGDDPQFGASNLTDGNLKTMWHTHGPEGRVAPPHEVVIHLDKAEQIAGFYCMPRHDGCNVGLVDPD